MTRTTAYLRVASGLLLVHAILHTAGGVFGAPPPGPGVVAYEAMQSNRFL